MEQNIESNPMPLEPQILPPLSEPPKKSNTTLIIVIVVVVLLLCCCCATVAILYNYGDQIFGKNLLQGLTGLVSAFA